MIYAIRDQLQEALNEAYLLDSDQVIIPIHAAECLLDRHRDFARNIVMMMHQTHTHAKEQAKNENLEISWPPEIGGKIQAIKVLRIATDMSLKEAKDAIEAELRAFGYRQWRDSDE